MHVEAEGIEYSTQVYNIAVEVFDDTQGDVKAQVTITEDAEGAQSVTAHEVDAEFVNVVEAEEIVTPPTEDPTEKPEDVPVDNPTVPEPSETPDSSKDEHKDSENADVPETGFVAFVNNGLWIAFIAMLVVALAGIIFTSKRK